MSTWCGGGSFLAHWRERILRQQPTDVQSVPQLRGLLDSALLSKLAYREPAVVEERWKHVQSGAADAPPMWDDVSPQTEFLLRRLLETMPHGPHFITSPAASVEDAQAYVWRKDDVLWVVFRGSSNVEDMLASIDVRVAYGGMEDVYLHRGFYEQFQSVESVLAEWLDRHVQDGVKTIVFTGHSLGSSLAQIAAAWYGARAVNPALRIVCHTFGCPRTGNTGFVEWFEKHVSEHIRIVNTQDPVPMIPQRYVWTHVPNVCYAIDDACQLYQRARDDPWYLRLFFSLISVDIQHPIRDHACDLYIARLHELLEKQSPTTV